MKTKKIIVRLPACALVVVFLAVHLVSSGFNPDPARLCVYVQAGALLLTLCPSKHDWAGLHFRTMAACAAACIVLMFINPCVCIALAALSLLELVAMAVLLAFRFSEVRPLFGNAATWQYIEDTERLFTALAYQCVNMVCSVMDMRDGPAGWMPFCIAVACFALLLAWGLTGLHIFVSQSREVEIARQMRGRIQPARRSRNDEEADRMSKLYDRIITVMEENKAFLNPSFELEDLAKAVFCNRTYVSKTVNTITGLNFKQYLNSFRVEYATELMKKDRKLQIQEIAAMSGFATTPSMNSAFKYFKGVTPGRFSREYLSSLTDRER